MHARGPMSVEHNGFTDIDNQCRTCDALTSCERAPNEDRRLHEVPVAVHCDAAFAHCIGGRVEQLH